MVDDRDPDEDGDGYESMDDYLDAQSADTGTDSTPSGVQADRVTVDPALFGEWPDGEIEIVDDSGIGPISGKEQHEWEREALIVDMIDACPYCDGRVTKRKMKAPDGDTIVRRHCRYCDESWVSNQSAGYTGPV